MPEKDFTMPNSIAVSVSALLHNLAFFMSMTGKRVIPVVKGNAYGHGIEQVATALRGKDVPYIAVDNYHEALRVRAVSKQPVLIMGILRPENFAHLRYDHFAFVVQDAATIRALGATSQPVKVHLECNTGMNRYGAQPGEAAALTRLIQSYKNLELEGVMSHLATSDGSDQATIDAAVAGFDACVDLVRSAGARPTMLHVAQTAGSVRAKSAYANTVRIGLGLYGVNPFPPGHDLYETLHPYLRPALTLTSTITKITELEKGSHVGYGYTFTAPKTMNIGVLPLGYYEALDPRLAGRGAIGIGQDVVPIAGRICMNTTMINLDGVDAHVGDEVVVYSNDPAAKNTVEAASNEHGLFRYDMLARLSVDIQRILVS
jgi:alanine racemase